MKLISNNIKTIQAVSHRMACIYNMSKRKVSSVSTFIEKEISSIDSETYPKSDDWKKLKNHTRSVEAAPGIFINAITVPCLDEIPDTSIYFIDDLKQFAISINGTILRGNIGNIYEKIQTYKRNVYECKNYEKCKNKNKLCNYFHDPLKLKNYGVVSNYLSRNFMNSSWLHTDSLKTMKNINLRHFGNKNTLCNDLKLIKYDRTYKREISTRFSQSMHDLLIILSLDQYDLLD